MSEQEGNEEMWTSPVAETGGEEAGWEALRTLAQPACVASLTAENERLRQERDEARALVDDLRDPDPCSYDHHGYCQAHGWLTEGECADARAARLAAAVDSYDTPDGES